MVMITRETEENETFFVIIKDAESDAEVMSYLNKVTRLIPFRQGKRTALYIQNSKLKQAATPLIDKISTNGKPEKEPAFNVVEIVNSKIQILRCDLRTSTPRVFGGERSHVSIFSSEIGVLITKSKGLINVNLNASSIQKIVNDNRVKLSILSCPSLYVYGDRRAVQNVLLDQIEWHPLLNLLLYSKDFTVSKDSIANKFTGSLFRDKLKLRMLGHKNACFDVSK